MQHPQSTNAPLKTFGRLVKANDTHLAEVISRRRGSPHRRQHRQAANSANEDEASALVRAFFALQDDLLRRTASILIQSCHRPLVTYLSVM
jgi:hypothetical protein